MSITFISTRLNKGHVQRAVDWPHSTFHRYVRDGVYAHDWAVTMEVEQSGSVLTFQQNVGMLELTPCSHYLLSLEMGDGD